MVAKIAIKKSSVTSIVFTERSKKEFRIEFYEKEFSLGYASFDNINDAESSFEEYVKDFELKKL